VYHSREPVQIILYNLLINSLKCTGAGYIRVTASRNEKSLTFTVSDTGPGLTRDKISELQDLHYNHSPAAPDSTDSGLGYIIIKDLLRLLQGKICLENDEKRGLRVEVTLPAVVDEG
jgi:signal transduction histidine kinase